MLIFQFPQRFDSFGTVGTRFVYLKLHAIEKRKRVCWCGAGLLRSKENVPAHFGIYTDDGPKHRLNFISVKTAIMAIQTLLNADMAVVTRTVPSHLHLNLPKKMNCILNLGLYSIGCMWQEDFTALTACDNNFQIILLKRKKKVCNNRKCKELTEKENWISYTSFMGLFPVLFRCYSKYL